MLGTNVLQGQLDSYTIRSISPVAASQLKTAPQFVSVLGFDVVCVQSDFHAPPPAFKKVPPLSLAPGPMIDQSPSWASLASLSLPLVSGLMDMTPIRPIGTVCKE